MDEENKVLTSDNSSDEANMKNDEEVGFVTHETGGTGHAAAADVDDDVEPQHAQQQAAQLGTQSHLAHEKRPGTGNFHEVTIPAGSSSTGHGHDAKGSIPSNPSSSAPESAKEDTSPASESAGGGNAISVGFKKPVMMFGPRPGFKKADKKVQDVLAGKADEKKKTQTISGNTSEGGAGSSKTDKSNLASVGQLQDKGHKQVKSGPSPAEQLSQKSITLPYKEPVWGGLCETGDYKFEVLKNGTIVDEIDLSKKSFFVFGRLPSCDITMEHPSLSRYHAIMQCCAKKNSLHDLGWYLYDLDSTHGTWINKNKITPRVYFRVRVGHVLKFGGSSRLHILQGPPVDQEEESALSITEMKEQREKQKKEAEVLRQAEMEERERKETILNQDTSCSWGIDMEEAQEDNSENPFALEAPENESLYIEDPKKALRGYFEREGFDMPQYEFFEAGFGKHHCKVELPVDSATGEPIFAEVIVSGKKKEAVVQCALEACRILDRMGELRKATHESHKKKARNWADDDYYDSDEDTFLDRTGTIEKKRMERMKKAGKHDSAVETYDTLVEKLNSIQVEIMSLETQLERARKEAEQHESDDLDDLDVYMSSIKSGVMDKSMRMKLKARLFELKQEEQKLTKLVNVAKPASLPQLTKPPDVKKGPLSSPPATQKALPMFGKMKGPSATSGPRKVKGPLGPPKSSEEISQKDDDVVEEEDDSDEEMSKKADDSNQSKHVPPAAARRTEEESVTGSSKIQREKADKRMQVKPSNAMKRTLVPGLEEKMAQVKKSKSPMAYDDTDPDYAVWMPPPDQSGDGRTSLNEKYGY